MPKVQMEATMRQNYEGRALRSGDSFDALSETDAQDLEALHLAKRKEPKAALLKSRDMKAVESDESNSSATAEDPPANGSSLTQPPTEGSGRYNRRDVRAAR